MRYWLTTLLVVCMIGCQPGLGAQVSRIDEGLVFLATEIWKTNTEIKRLSHKITRLTAWQRPYRKKGKGIQ